MVPATFQDKLNSLPKSPGVYLFHNDRGKVIYVGKAKVLKDRVYSYFVDNLELGSKTRSLVENVRNLEYIEVQSELEALLLESELIKRYRPKYNISLKDDKSYKYIVVSRESIDGEVYPVVRTSRQKNLTSELSRRDYYYGPFPEGRTVSHVIRTLRKIVPFRDCSVSKFRKYRKLKSPCLYGHIGLCTAPCVGRISEEDYKKDILLLRRILSGESSTVRKGYEIRMKNASKSGNYELAASYRDQLRRFDYVTQSFEEASTYIENPNLVTDIRAKSLDELVKVVTSLKNPLRRIECYDISNISGKDATASMVVATDGILDRSQYRRFRIKYKSEPDDFAMIAEVISRRFKRTDWPYPDLVVIDGGKGQVASARKALSELNLEFAVIGLAKRLETIVTYNGNNFEEIRLPDSNEGLKLLMRLRDEAHRFARRYHHLLRSKALSS